LAEAGLNGSGKLLDEAAKKVAFVRNKDGENLKATLEAALLSVDPNTGEILAMVGGRNYNTSKFNRTHQALRSPGSAFKPVVYAQALAQNWKWSDLIFVSPITIDNYRPRTPDEDFGKETTLLRAFYRSMNTPTVEIGQKIGLKPVVDMAKHLGIRTPLKDEFGILLGSSDVSMMDLSRMYSSFANSGKLVEHIAITKIVNRDGKILYQAPSVSARSTSAVSPQIAFLMTEGMRTVLQFGTAASAGHLANYAVGKTGTSNDSTDNWFCGYAPNLTTIVWVGTDEHARMFGNATGSKLALPIWEKYMATAFKIRPPTHVNPPDNVVATVVNPQFGTRADTGVRMYFLKGNEPPAESAASALEALSATSAAGYRDVFKN
jgi:penicillin-binding protein 1A